LDRKSGEFGTYWPEFLPDGDHFLFLSGRGGAGSNRLNVGSVRSKNARSLGPILSRAEYASGHMLYVSGGTLVARSFDPRTLSFRGDPAAVAENVVADPDGGYAAFSTAPQGTILYRTAVWSASERFTWLNRSGQRLATLGNAGFYESPALSPDGSQLAFNQTDPIRGHGRVWIWDIARNVGWPISQPDRRALAPAWAPDGKRVAYGMQVPGPSQFDIFAQAAAGSGIDSLLYTSREVKDVACWSADGRWLVYMVASSTRSGVDICAISLPEKARSVSFVATRASEFHPALSPDGSLLAYESNLSGRSEIYVQGLSGDKQRIQVSLHGGTQPSWRSDGRELYYLSLDGDLMALKAQPGMIQLSGPKRLFQAPVRLRFDARNQYVPGLDGQRFLFVSPEGNANSGTTVVMTNWVSFIAKK
jgi:WD40 repeat protein